MGETRYFIFNNEAAFARCRLDGAFWDGDSLKAERGSLRTPTMDGGESALAWPRVLADVAIPHGAKIVWRLYAGERETALREAFTIENADDFIPVGAVGRFAALEANLYGGVEIRSIRVFSQWESFLDYLPEIYREQNGFTDRFLRLFSAQYLDLERRIDEAPGRLDPAVAREDQLRRLAENVGVPHVNLWRTEGLRKLLVNGVYARRGQFSAFEDYIEYFTGFRPYVAENFRFLNGRPENDRLYQNGDVTVFLPPRAADHINADALDTVIADFLPGDVVWSVVLLNPYPVVSEHAYLGVNTRIGAYEGTVVGKSRLGFSVVGGVT